MNRILFILILIFGCSVSVNKKSYNFKKRGKKLAIYVNLGYFDLFTT